MYRHCSPQLTAAALTFAACTLASAQTEIAPNDTDAGLPASMAGFSDEGVFDTYRAEERLVRTKFNWRTDGSYEMEAVVTLGGQTMTISGKITPDSDGRFARMQFDLPTGQQLFEREGANVRFSHKDTKRTVTLKKDALLFENVNPAFISLAVRSYDRAKGGPQTQQFFILNALSVHDATLEFIDSVERAVGGRDIKLQRYKLSVPGADLTVWAGDEGKIYFVDIPAQRSAYVREGYESLRMEEKSDPTLSQPTFEVTEDRGVGVPMRDGIKLSTDIYRPKGEGKFPVILIRTPYKKEMSELEGKYYARRGYVVAIQDCRGRFGSPGEWEPFVNEKADGYDAIEWLAVQPWSTGKVGMIGASYLGWVQWFALSQNPPHLTTIIPNVAPPDAFFNFPYEYGVFFIYGGIWWADIVATDATGDLSGVKMSAVFNKKYGKLLRDLPVIDLDKKILGGENKYWRTWIKNNTNNEYWARASFSQSLQNASIPVFHQSGWFDGDGIGSKLNYAALAKHGKSTQKLILGPWGHTPEAHRMVGDIDFGPEAAPDLPRMYLRWFDHWLKGIDNGIQKEPLVSLFVMNTNKWVHGDKYPLPQTKFEKWYFASGGQANTSKGDGKLTREAPAVDSPPDKYTYDPGDPTPNPGFYEESEEEEKEEKVVEEQRKLAKKWHEQVTDSRKDILVYTTDPFEQHYTFAGPISATLYAASSAKDTDWFVRLIEIEGNGELHSLVEGRFRARFRDSMSQPKLLEPGKIYEYTIDMWQTGLTVEKGSRLRIEVASASYPYFSRNLNTGGHNEMETAYVPADQTIYHDAKHPSHVVLPHIPEMNSEAQDR